jgi:hypothetical protein
MIGKRGAWNLYDDWGEIATLMLLVFGLVLSFVSGSAFITYLMIVICGIAVGRWYFLRKHSLRFPFYMITFGFLVGFLLGVSITGRGSPLGALVLFFVGAYLGIYLHSKKILR